MDFTIKNKSPEFVVPENWYYYKEPLLRNLHTIKGQLKHSIENLDLTKTCTGFEVPVIGLLTRFECVYFVIFHTKRHTRQLEKYI